MSKDRARRRVQREAVRAAAQAIAARRQERRTRLRALRRRFIPRFGRRAWLLGRRSRAQRLAIGVAGVALLWGVWSGVADWPSRIAFSLLVVLVLPVLVIVTFDRRV